MVVFAHPDDPDFSVAGTVAVWTQAGSEVVYVLCTSGNVGSHEPGMTRERIAALREVEQRAAAAAVGVKEVIFLHHDDGTLQPTLELRRELVREMRRFRPNVLVCGDPVAFLYGDSYINHPDHRAAAQAALEAVFPAVSMPLVFPDLLQEGFEPHRVNEVWVTDSTTTNTYVDISQVVDRKIAALRCHTSQMENWDPTEMVKKWATETGQEVGLPMAEGYRRMILAREEPPTVEASNESPG
ncbi:MAG: PIG-L family deacetylase [Chloroflexi bacterium]|nr:PIG-L family deacetylase [Chloroflexota bacterium]